MSISELLVPNNFNLFANSITLKTGAVSEAFSAYFPLTTSISTSADTQVLFTGTLVSSINYNQVTSIFTVPNDGFYKMDISVAYNYSLNGGDIDSFYALQFDLILGASTILRSIKDQIFVTKGIPYDSTLYMSWFGFLSAGNQIKVVSKKPLTGGTPQLYFINSDASYWSVIQH